MSTILEQLLKEMWKECGICDGEGKFIPYVVGYSATAPYEVCNNCRGKGKVLSTDARKLRHLILKGRYAE